MEALLVLGGVAVLSFLVYHGWKAWTDPPVVLGRQAAHMNWVTSRYIKQDGFRHMCVKRNGMEAMIVHNTAHVLLISPPTKKIFKDFIELEHWIASGGGEAVDVNSASAQRASDTPRLARFLEEAKRWPPHQAGAAGFIINSIMEKNGADLDPAFDELTASQMETVTEVVRELVGD